MIVLWILLALLLLFLLLLFSPITFLLRWKDELQVKVRFLFVTIDVMKMIRKGDKKKKRKFTHFSTNTWKNINYLL